MKRQSILTAALVAAAGAGLAVGLVAAAAGPDPAKPPGTPQREALDRAWAEMDVYNWTGALEVLEDVVAKASDPADLAEANYALGHCWQFRSGQEADDVERARGFYRTVVERYPAGEQAPWAQVSLARIADAPVLESDRRRDDARRLYEKVRSEWPDHAAADEATVRLAVTYLEEVGDAASEDVGAAMLRKRLAKRPENFLAMAMHMLLGRLHQRRGEYAEAVEHYVAGYEAGLPGKADRAETAYRIGQIAENELKDYRLAAKWYGVVVEIRRDNKYFVARQGVQRCRKLAAGAGEGR